jgi:hypothetical protein
MLAAITEIESAMDDSFVVACEGGEHTSQSVGSAMLQVRAEHEFQRSRQGSAQDSGHSGIPGGGKLAARKPKHSCPIKACPDIIKGKKKFCGRHISAYESIERETFFRMRARSRRKTLQRNLRRRRAQRRGRATPLRRS